MKIINESGSNSNASVLTGDILTTSDSGNIGREVVSAVLVIKRCIEINRLPEKNVYACICLTCWLLSRKSLIQGIQGLFEPIKILDYIKSRGEHDYEVVLDSLQENRFGAPVVSAAFLCFVMEKHEFYPEFAS